MRVSSCHQLKLFCKGEKEKASFGSLPVGDEDVKDLEESKKKSKAVSLAFGWIEAEDPIDKQ